MNIETRTAPAGARLNHLSAADGLLARTAAARVDTAAIYGRLSARQAGPRAAAPIPDMPGVLQISAGPVLNGGAINARHSALAAARTGYRHQSHTVVKRG